MSVATPVERLIPCRPAGPASGGVGQPAGADPAQLPEEGADENWIDYRNCSGKPAETDRQDRYLGWGEDQRMWKHLHRAGARVGLYRSRPNDGTAETCSDECDENCDHRQERRRRLLQRIVDDDVPSEPVWVRTPDDPEMIFTISPPTESSR